MSEFLDVQEFHAKFNVPVPLDFKPLSPEVLEFRVKFMQEELDEFSESAQRGDMVGMFDALLDLVWVAKGTADFMGLEAGDWDMGWAAVATANLSKRRAVSASESKRGTSLDIVKPLGWVGPEARLKEILFIK